jgi:hypothetical protein
VSAPTLGDLLGMVAALHANEAVTDQQAIEILADLIHITPKLAGRMLRVAAEHADDWRGPLRRDENGRWTA